MKKISPKRQAEIELRRNLKAELILEQKGLCARCGQKPDWRGLTLWHRIRTGRGGETTRENCQAWCGPCHDRWHDTEEYQWRKAVADSSPNTQGISSSPRKSE